MNKNLQAELKSWDVAEPKIRQIKLEREWVRYSYLIEKLGLQHLLYLHEKTALDIGPGPLGGLLQLLSCKEKITLDPLNEEYLKRFPEFYNDSIKYVTGEAEAMPFPDKRFDLVLCTNALDHTENPEQVIREIKRVLAPSGYVAIQFCLNLGKIHPHEAHINALSQETFLGWVKYHFETIHCTVGKYGWVRDPNDRTIGQPAIFYLGRNVEPCN